MHFRCGGVAKPPSAKRQAVRRDLASHSRQDWYDQAIDANSKSKLAANAAKDQESRSLCCSLVVGPHCNKKPGRFSRVFCPTLQSGYQVQVITPLVLLHVFADCECVAVPLHVAGGPATAVATIVTFCEGVKPCTGDVDVAVPEK